MSSIGEFLLARIAEDEEVARAATKGPWDLHGGNEWLFPFGYLIGPDGDIRAVDADHIIRHDPIRVLAECEAKRAIIKAHEDWPVLIERRPDASFDPGDPSGVVFRASAEIAWLTEREYVKRFGTEPPTTPMLRALAAVYRDHEDYREEWS